MSSVKLIVFSPCANVRMVISVSEQMRKDYLDCKAAAKKLGDGKDCQSCSWNNLEVFGTGICELPIIEDYIRI